MRAVDLIAVPYDSGHRGERMGRGPLDLREHGAADLLRGAGLAVRETTVEAFPGFHTEVAAGFELARATALAVRAAQGRSAFPLMLAGNCGASVGVVAGLAGEVGVLWLDAHADLNTPDTTLSGFADGMALATLTGRAWRALAGTVSGFAPVADERVVHVGGRDLDAAEEAAFAASHLARVTVEAARAGGVEAALNALAGRVTGLYVHVDLDVLDPSEARANPYAAPGGLTVAELHALLRAAAARLPFVAAAITAYDPAADPSGRARAAALGLVSLLAELGVPRG